MNEQIIKLYLEGISGIKIAKALNCSEKMVYRVLAQNGIERRSNKLNSRKYTCNHNFFSSVNTEEQAYWLGFLLADGYLSKCKSQLMLGLSLSEKDISHLEKFKTALKSTYPIHSYKVTSGYKPGSPYTRILITSETLFRDLENWNMIEHKTATLEFPLQIPETMYHHCLRGYFDGDGCWSRAKKTKLGYVFKLNGTKEFLNTVQDLLEIKVALNQKGNNFQLSKGGTKDLLRIGHYLYSDATIYLDRKHNRYVSMTTVPLTSDS